MCSIPSTRYHKRQADRFSKASSWAGLLTFVTAALLFMASCPGSASAQTYLRIGDPLPRMSLPDINGNKVTLPDDAAGKIAVVHILSKWCRLCETEMAAMQYIQTLYAERGVVCYWINVGDSTEGSREFLARTKFNWPVLSDPKSAETKRCGEFVIPATLVCDKNGFIQGKLIGEVTANGIQKLLRPMMASSE